MKGPRFILAPGTFLNRGYRLSPCQRGCAPGTPLWRLLTSLLDIVGNLGKKSPAYFLWHSPGVCFTYSWFHTLQLHTGCCPQSATALGTILFLSRVSLRSSFFSVDADCTLGGVVSLNYLNSCSNRSVQCAALMCRRYDWPDDNNSGSFNPGLTSLSDSDTGWPSAPVPNGWSRSVEVTASVNHAALRLIKVLLYRQPERGKMQRTTQAPQIMHVFQEQVSEENDRFMQWFWIARLSWGWVLSETKESGWCCSREVWKVRHLTQTHDAETWQQESWESCTHP